MKWGLWGGGNGDGSSSFWGMNKSGKDSAAAIPEMANWANNRAQYSADRSNESRALGTAKNEEAWDYWKNRAATGIGTTGDVRAAGEAAMPGVQAAIDKRNQLLAQQNQNWADFQGKTPQMMAQVNSNLDQMGGNIRNTVDFNQDIINKGFADLDAIAGNANADVVNNIKESFASGRMNFNDAYNAMREAAKGTYSGLQGSLEGTYDESKDNIEVLKPGSEAFMARTARSYAPMMSNTMGRLRASNIDPNSAQAGGMLAQAESERGRGIDDAAAVGAEKYAASANSLLANRQAGRERLGIAGLGTDLELGTTQAGTNLDLGLAEGANFRNEVVRDAGVRSGIIGDKRNLDLQNSDLGYTESQGLLDKRNDAAQLERASGLQDYGITQGLADKGMTEAMVSPEALAAQFAAGQGYSTANTAAQNAGGTAMSASAQSDLARSIQESMLAQGYSQEAIDAHLKNLGIQSANAGWGTKMIISAAQQAASAAAGAP